MISIKRKDFKYPMMSKKDHLLKSHKLTITKIMESFNSYYEPKNNIFDEELKILSIIRANPYYITNDFNFTEGHYSYILERDGKYLEYVKNQTFDLVKKAYISRPNSIQFCSIPLSDSQYRELIDINSETFSYFPEKRYDLLEYISHKHLDIITRSDYEIFTEFIPNIIKQLLQNDQSNNFDINFVANKLLRSSKINYQQIWQIEHYNPGLAQSNPNYLSPAHGIIKSLEIFA